MGLGKKIAKIVATKKIPIGRDAYRRKILSFMDTHGVEVTENILKIPRGTLYSWKKAKETDNKKGRKYGRK